MGHGGLAVSWTWAAASSRGTSHIKDGSACQDRSACAMAGDHLVAIVCDGAGSALLGGQGATIAVRTVMQSARRHFAYVNEMPSDEEVWEWLDAVRDRIARAAMTREVDPKQFAATLVACIAGPKQTLVAHIGDGACVTAVDALWQTASWPENGEYASTTFFVTDSPAPRLRITRLPAIDAAAVFTDGIERLVLDFGKRAPHAPWFERFIKPVVDAGVHGRNASLSTALTTYLDSAAVTDHSDDDKTLILAARV